MKLVLWLQQALGAPLGSKLLVLQQDQEDQFSCKTMF